MDRYVYDAICNYFAALGKLGYISDKRVEELVALIFYFNLMYNDFRGYVSSEDYKYIERALNCFYGNNCLIPYPDYLKMGNLRIGDITELAHRTKALEEYDKELDQRIKDNDLLIRDNVKRIDEHEERLFRIEKTKVIKGKNHIQDVPEIDLSKIDIINDDN